MAQEHSKNTKRALNGNFLLDHPLGAELGSFFVKTSGHTGAAAGDPTLDTNRQL